MPGAICQNGTWLLLQTLLPNFMFFARFTEPSSANEEGKLLVVAGMRWNLTMRCCGRKANSSGAEDRRACAHLVFPAEVGLLKPFLDGAVTGATSSKPKADAKQCAAVTETMAMLELMCVL